MPGIPRRFKQVAAQPVSPRSTVVGGRCLALGPCGRVYAPPQLDKFRFRNVHLEFTNSGLITVWLLRRLQSQLVLSSGGQDTSRAGHDADVPIASMVALAARGPHP